MEQNMKKRNYSDIVDGEPQFNNPITPKKKRKCYRSTLNASSLSAIEARHIRSKFTTLPDSFLQTCLIPEETKTCRCRTVIISNTNNPVYNEKFSFELTEEDLHKRVMVSIWHQDSVTRLNEFWGCTSFGVASLMKPKKTVNGWYYLLTETVGRKKHMQVATKEKLLSTNKRRASLHPVIPAINKDITGVEQLNLTVHRGKGGFGFTLVESCPVKVGRVDRGSRASETDLREHDAIVRVNGVNVSRSTSVSVAKLIKNSGSMVTLDLIRPNSVIVEALLSKSNLKGGQSTLKGGQADEGYSGHISYPTDDRTTPLLRNSIYDLNKCCQDAVSRLLSQDMDFVELMRYGMQLYSRPLRHCILSQSQYGTLFRNIEKLVTISEYQIRQLQDAMLLTSCDDTDTSGQSEDEMSLSSIGMIYMSKLHLLVQAYTHYAQGITDANLMLVCLLRSTVFHQFYKNIPIEGRSLSLTTFLRQPLRHIIDIQSTLKDILQATPTDSPDHVTFYRLVEGLQPCVTTILNITRHNDINITSSEFKTTILLKKIMSRSSQRAGLNAPLLSSLGSGPSLGSGVKTSGSSLSSRSSGVGSSISSRCSNPDAI
ncbi:hypothetical protein ACJMK2_040355 [Sinanodonta woodiana]|uniref:Uncharacterized protein n=1 Tax=Sinanodonta woodiana TaxID=1069815 RepID=A0ABD3WI79_SINWO